MLQIISPAKPRFRARPWTYGRRCQCSLVVSVSPLPLRPTDNEAPALPSQTRLHQEFEGGDTDQTWESIALDELPHTLRRRGASRHPENLLALAAAAVERTSRCATRVFAQTGIRPGMVGYGAQRNGRPGLMQAGLNQLAEQLETGPPWRRLEFEVGSRRPPSHFAGTSWKYKEKGGISKKAFERLEVMGNGWLC